MATRTCCQRRTSMARSRGYDNLGDGEFSAQHVITAEARQATAVHAADLDGDGDPDVLTASDYGNRIAWHENQGGGAFSEQRLIVNENGAARSVHAADLDGDGDADVLFAESFDDKIAWLENQGGGTFSEQRVITTDADNAVSVHAADLDGDGDGGCAQRIPERQQDRLVREPGRR